MSYTKTFNDWLPYYLHLGMTWDQYWNGDASMPRYYRKAHELCRQEENQKMWLMGAYVYDAILRLQPILQAFPKAGTKAIPYLDNPYPLTQDERNEQEEAREKLQSEKMKARMAGWAKKTNDIRENLMRKGAVENGRDGENKDIG